MSKSKAEQELWSAFSLPFRLIFMEDDEEKKAAKVSSWRDQNEEDG